MISFLFWNVNKKTLNSVITRLAIRYSVDVIILAEFIPGNETDLLIKLNSHTDMYFNYIPKIACERIDFFVRFPNEFIITVYEETWLTMRRLLLPALKDVMIAAVHLPSKLRWKDSDQAGLCYRISSTISDQEKKFSSHRTILLGDLNMNPFEDGVVSAMGFHGISSRKLAEKCSRVIGGKEYNYFYNPMWAYFGDNPSPPGTYYYYESNPKAYFWNMFDQVLIRPELIPYFDNENLTSLKKRPDSIRPNWTLLKRRKV